MTDIQLLNQVLTINDKIKQNQKLNECEIHIINLILIAVAIGIIRESFKLTSFINEL